MEHSLLDQTLVLLRQSELPREEIARGANVGLDWLKKLLGGHIDDPSVRRIQRLYDFLKEVSPSDQQQGA